MKNRNILFLSLIATIFISLIPIPQKTFVGRGPTYEDLPSYGLPITIAKFDVFESPTNTIHWYPEDIAGYAILFTINFLIYAIIIKLIFIIYSKFSKLKTPSKLQYENKRTNH